MFKLQSVFSFTVSPSLLRHICKAHKPTPQNQSLQKSLNLRFYQLLYFNWAFGILFQQKHHGETQAHPPPKYTNKKIINSKPYFITTRMPRKLLNILIVVCIAITLFNSNAFGSKTLIASFGYNFFVSILGIVFCLHSIFTLKKINYKLTGSLLCFWAFCCYVLISSIITNNFQINSFYWFSSLIFFTVVYLHFQTAYSNKFHYFIIGLSALESLIIVLQFVKLFPVPSSYFLCTGTWINPNVIAMFLAISVFSILKLIQRNHSKITTRITKAALVLVCIAIALLKCRTGYIILLIQLVPFYFYSIKSFLATAYKFKQKSIFLLCFFLILLLAIVNVFKQKNVSTSNRLNIWENSIKLGLQKPLFGFGSASFEKQYNLFSVNQNLQVNDHINMAYNDFLEIFVEMGLFGVLIWFFFLMLLLFKQFKFKQFSTNFWLVIAVISLQSTNFGFQAIPAFVLILFYFALNHSEKQFNQSQRVIVIQNSILKRIFIGLLFASSLYLFINNNKLSWAFYKKSLVTKSSDLIGIVSLNKMLNNYASYNKLLGEKYYSVGNYNQSKIAFSKALAYSSEPDLFIKRAYVFQKLNLKDSALHDYNIAIKMQPHKLTHKLLLLQFYQSMQDSTNSKIIANEILNTPIKIKTKKAFFIKEYAKKILK
jgi:O-antigen ligase